MPVQARALETHNHLLQAAATCFGRHGYEQSSVALICQEAGVSKGAFYHHFGSKQDLFIELIDGWLAALDAQIRFIDTEASSVPDALRRMASLLAQVFTEARGQLPLVLDYWSQARLDPAIWSRTVAPFRRYREYFRDLIERGIAQGALAEVDADNVAAMLVSLSVGYILQGLLDADAADWGQLAERSVHLLIARIERPSLPRNSEEPGVSA